MLNKTTTFCFFFLKAEKLITFSTVFMVSSCLKSLTYFCFLVRREGTVASLISLGAAPGALTDPSPKYPSCKTPADLASDNGHKGIAGYLAESALSAHLISLNLDEEGKAAETSVVQTVSEKTATPSRDGDSDRTALKDTLAAVCNATQAAARIHQVYRVQSFQRKQLKEYGDDKFGMSNERALSLIAVKAHKTGQHDDRVHADAAIRIQNKFRSWKGRKDYLIIRQRIVKIQASARVFPCCSVVIFVYDVYKRSYSFKGI